MTASTLITSPVVLTKFIFQREILKKIVGTFLETSVCVCVLVCAFWFRSPKYFGGNAQGLDEGGTNTNIGILVPAGWRDKGQFWFRSHALWNLLRLNSVREAQLRDTR